MEDVINQSSFSHDQDRLLAPPEVLDEKAQKLMAKKPWSMRKKLLVGSGVFFVFFLVVGVIYKTFFYVAPVEEVFIAPSPTPISIEQTQLQKELNSLSNSLEFSNPYRYSFPPPPVDMNVTF